MYSHTQFGWLTMFALAAAVGVIGLTGIQVGPEAPGRGVLMAGQALIVLLIPLFGWLTVTVDEEAVTAKFGVGFIQRKIRIREIQSATRVRNTWIMGWGIRLGPSGWMFNVSGLDAVELELKGGGKFRIGTDEPEELVRALRQRMVLEL